MSDPAHSQKLFLRVGLLLGLPGVLLLGLAQANLVPTAWLARLASHDKQLSTEYLSYLQGSQHMLGLLFLTAGILTAIAHRLSGRFSLSLHQMNMRTFAWCLSLTATLLTALVQWLLFDGIPHVTDASTHLFQAKLLCMGKLYAPHPRCWESFHQYWTILTESGRWFSYYPPGHALTFVPFMLAGLTFWTVPVATGITVYACLALIHRFYGDLTARWSGLLLMSSPLLLLLGASYMSHVTFMMYLFSGFAAGLWALDEQRSRKTARLGLTGSGFLLAMALLVRPQNAVFLLPTLGLVLFLSPRSFLRQAVKATPWALLGAVPPLLFMAYWNQALYGTPFTIGYGQVKIDNMTPIMSLSVGFTETFKLKDAVFQFIVTMNRLNKVLFGWPVSLLIFPLAFFRLRMDRRDLLCGLVIAMLTTFFFFYFYYGYEYEARFFAPILPLFAVLTVRGGMRLRELLSARLPRFAREIRILLFGLLFICVGHGLCHYWPRYIWPNYAGDYEHTTTLAHDIVEEAGLKNCIVLLPNSDNRARFRFTSGFIYNDPLLKNDVIYGRDLPHKYACLFTSYPDRTIYRFIPDNRQWTGGRLEEMTREQVPDLKK